MTPERIRAAIAAARDAQAAGLARWAALYVAAGCALEAASRGDRAQARRWLYDAADAEAALLGEARQFGPLTEGP